MRSCARLRRARSPRSPRSAQIHAGEAAANRCNSLTIDGASARVRDYDRHPPGDAPGAAACALWRDRGRHLDAHEEHEILNGVCSTETQKAPLLAQIAAISAWALALESDIAARLNASCPPAAKAFPTIMLADAWLLLANGRQRRTAGAVPPDFSEVIPKIQSRAQAVGLTLPAWGDTSQYWRDQVDAKEKPIIQAVRPSPDTARPEGSAYQPVKDFANNSQIIAHG